MKTSRTVLAFLALLLAAPLAALAQPGYVVPIKALCTSGYG